MKTAEEIASMFFVDTGEKKSTNWKRLRDLVALRDREVITRCAQEADPDGSHAVCARRIRALADPPAGSEVKPEPKCICAKLSVEAIIQRPRRGHFLDCPAHPEHETWLKQRAPAGTGGRR